ncbi:MAG: hypothetical protein ACI976_001569, partial [Aureispira sp.]
FMKIKTGLVLTGFNFQNLRVVEVFRYYKL